MNFCDDVYNVDLWFVSFGLEDEGLFFFSTLLIKVSNMVYTAAQQTQFFQDPAQMNIPAATRLQLIQEGITFVNDLAELTEDNLKIISDNFCCPTGQVPDPNADLAQHAPVLLGSPPLPTIAQLPFVFGAILYNHIKVSAELIRYYQTVGRPLSVANMQWNPIGCSFEHHWRALVDQKKKDNPGRLPGA